MFDGQLHPTPVTLGASDGVNTEVIGDGIHEGLVLATRVADVAARQAGGRHVQPADATAGAAPQVLSLPDFSRL